MEKIINYIGKVPIDPKYVFWEELLSQRVFILYSDNTITLWEL